MKRIIFFLIILALTFTIAFVSTILLFPEWLARAGWASNLTIKIVVGGAGIIVAAILSWALKFLLEDQDFNEWLSFKVGSKYRKILVSLDDFTRQEIGKEKKSKKYIPNVFVETTEIKEKLRYFSEPFDFFPKVIEQTDRRLQTAYIVNILKQLHYPMNEPAYPNLRVISHAQKSLFDAIQRYLIYLDQKLKLTDILIKHDGAGIKPEYLVNVPDEYSHIYQYTYHLLQFYWSYEYAIQKAKKDLELLKNNLVIIKSIAGHGKTNLICDFTDNFLLKKGHRCLYISAKALNNLGEQETLEHAMARTIFSEPDVRFSDVLRLVKFDKKIDYLFILIDGINEHKNLPLFSVALEQFIQRCKGSNLKIILTCRSEYFDDRFGNLLNIEGCSVLDLDEHEYRNEMPDVHIEALLSRYFSEFDVKISVENVYSDIMDVFNEDKLLLRVFCEAYEHEQPAEQLDNLYKLEIFNKYLEKKSDTIQGLDICLAEIVDMMLTDNQFVNVEISKLSAQAVEIVENTVYENVILKKDVLLKPGLAFGKSEVINFVYDEFRDYLIASRVIIEWDQNKPASIVMIQNLCRPQSPVAEGLQRYLCLWSIKNKNNDLLDYLSNQDWFDQIFISSVFDTPDLFLSAFVLELIKGLFNANSTNALHIIWQLIRRTNVKVYPNLNIEAMFSWLDEIDEVKYKEIIVEALCSDYDYESSQLTYLCRLIIEAFSANKVSEASGQNLIRLLCYFAGVKDLGYRRYRKYDLGKQPAFKSILELSSIIDKQLIYEQISCVFEDIGIEHIKNDLQALLEQLGDE